MSSNTTDLNALSDAEIRQKCRELGMANIPVTDTSRKLLINRISLLMGGGDSTLGAAKSTSNPITKNSRRETMFAAATEKPKMNPIINGDTVAGGSRSSRRTIAATPSTAAAVAAELAAPQVAAMKSAKITTRRISIDGDANDAPPIKTRRRSSARDNIPLTAEIVIPTVILESDEGDADLLSAVEQVEKAQGVALSAAGSAKVQGKSRASPSAAGLTQVQSTSRGSPSAAGLAHAQLTSHTPEKAAQSSVSKRGGSLVNEIAGIPLPNRDGSLARSAMVDQQTIQQQIQQIIHEPILQHRYSYNLNRPSSERATSLEQQHAYGNYLRTFGGIAGSNLNIGERQSPARNIIRSNADGTRRSASRPIIAASTLYDEQPFLSDFARNLERHKYTASTGERREFMSYQRKQAYQAHKPTARTSIGYKPNSMLEILKEFAQQYNLGRNILFLIVIFGVIALFYLFWQ